MLTSMSFADLTGANLTGADLAGAKVVDCKLSGEQVAAIKSAGSIAA
jgi:uncharacterized protein YjbI with pentapeptide repeats